METKPTFTKEVIIAMVVSGVMGFAFGFWTAEYGSRVSPTQAKVRVVCHANNQEEPICIVYEYIRHVDDRLKAVEAKLPQ